jgi:hypothetical protein
MVEGAAAEAEDACVGDCTHMPLSRELSSPLQAVRPPRGGGFPCELTALRGNCWCSGALVRPPAW